MKVKAALASILLITLALLTPAFAQQSTEPTFVMMHGRVERYGTNPAYGYCGVWAKVGEWAHVFAGWTWKPCITVIFNFYAARLMNTTLVELNYGGADLYISGLWNVYNVTFIFEPGGKYSFTVELLVDHGEGTLSVTGNWATFTIAIKYIDEVAGTVKRYCIRPIEPIPLGDLWGLQGAPDNRIDIWDLVHVAREYGSTPGMPERCYDFSMDFNFDYKIDILDLGTIAANLGEGY